MLLGKYSQTSSATLVDLVKLLVTLTTTLQSTASWFSFSVCAWPTLSKFSAPRNPLPWKETIGQSRSVQLEPFIPAGHAHTGLNSASRPWQIWPFLQGFPGAAHGSSNSQFLPAFPAGHFSSAAPAATANNANKQMILSMVLFSK